MSLRGWLRWFYQQTTPPRPAAGRRPRLGLEPLTDRVTPSHGGFGFVNDAGGPIAALAGNAGAAGSTGAAGPGRGVIWDGWWGQAGDTNTVATHFGVFAALDPHTGEATRLAVMALDANNNRVDNYTGTVHLTDTDPATPMPADYTFTAADRGRHTFDVTAATAGRQTVTATDTADSSVTGSVTLDVTPAPAATHFAVLARRGVATGTATGVVVLALDAGNRPVRNYVGTVHLTSTDPAATIPADYTFTAADNGVHAF